MNKGYILLLISRPARAQRQPLFIIRP